MLIQTLPNAVQARILWFLVEQKSFCALDLSKLAKNLLTDDQELDIWVKRAAHLLSDLVVPHSSYRWQLCQNLKNI